MLHMCSLLQEACCMMQQQFYMHMLLYCPVPGENPIIS